MTEENTPTKEMDKTPNEEAKAPSSNAQTVESNKKSKASDNTNTGELADKKDAKSGDANTAESGDEKNTQRRGGGRRPAYVSYTMRKDAQIRLEYETKKKMHQEKDIAGRRAFAEQIQEIKDGDVFYATGRRKTSTARVYMRPGTGVIEVNKRDVEEYFPRRASRLLLIQPLVKMGAEGKFDFYIRVAGSGSSGQAGAIRHGISRVLAKYDPERNLRRGGLLTRDPRSVERKKVGLHKARKRPQFSKR